MNDFLLSILLGIVEALFKLNLGDSFWKMYTIVIQLGAILALPVYFWKRILEFLSTFPKGERGDRNFLTHPLSLTVIAFIVTALPSWALTKVIGKNLESLWVITVALLVGCIVMWIVDATFTRVRVTHMEEMSLPQAIWIGACQILSAVFPGTSRSMSTIAAGQIAGMSRPAALEFSFFLSMPTMVVATCYDLFKTLKPNRNTIGEGNIAPLAVDSHQWIVLVIGFVVSFIVALVVVAWFMRWVRTKGFAPFAIYRIVLAIVLIILLMRGSI